MRCAISLFLIVWILVLPLLSAVGCDLNDPDRDVKRLFPESTSYKTLYASIAQKGGESMLRRVEERLGDKFQGLYETIDVPYTMYQIFKGKDLIGYIHGVNQKGTYGGTNLSFSFMKEGEVEIVTGVNLPMLIKFVSLQRRNNLKDVARKVLDQGKRNIHLASALLSSK